MRLVREHNDDTERSLAALLLLLDEFVCDDALDDEQRKLLREFITPRIALDGSLVYPLDELGASHGAA